MARLYAFVRSAAICFIALTALPGAVARADEGTLLKAEGIRETVSGKRIYLAIPFGGEFPLYYQRSGKVEGWGGFFGRLIAENGGSRRKHCSASNGRVGMTARNSVSSCGNCPVTNWPGSAMMAKKELRELVSRRLRLSRIEVRFRRCSVGI